MELEQMIHGFRKPILVIVRFVAERIRDFACEQWRDE
jgi:hypothetical protein